MTESSQSPLARCICTVLLAALQACSVSQHQASGPLRPPVSQPLFDEIWRMDSLLSVVYNAHDLNGLGRLFAEDLEFYHDTGGLLSYRQSLDGLKSVFENNDQARRTAYRRQMEIYPVKGYGAIQTGLHSFCHLENGKKVCATFKFIHIWRKKDGIWRISRVLSYDH